MFLISFTNGCSSAGHPFSTPSITPPLSTPIATSGGFPQSGDEPPDSDDDDKGPNTLSLGAILAIVLAIPLGASLIMALIGLWMASRARDRRKEMLEPYFASERLDRKR